MQNDPNEQEEKNIPETPDTVNGSASIQEEAFVPASNEEGVKNGPGHSEEASSQEEEN